ncbi:prolactin-inducible protein homolog [Sorex araneus]|uniref:prolactin-inducible protein homolog n=1 Tax=Sorex araneus TaxID=42254 RepID=UPI00243378DC|nr:prolactin-inducible protein homolog [Sorex araneus]
MQFLQLLPKASQTILILLVCIQLGINNAEDTDREVMIIDMDMPSIVHANEELSLTVRVSTELRECMVIRAYLIGSRPMDTSFNHRFTACLCEDYPRTFFWDFAANRTMKIAAVVDVVGELNICPENMAVVPISDDRFYSVKDLYVY